MNMFASANRNGITAMQHIFSVQIQDIHHYSKRNRGGKKDESVIKGKKDESVLIIRLVYDTLNPLQK